MNKGNKRKKGFTLMELIIVLAVMAIIALIAVPSFSAIRENAKVKADNRSEEAIKRVVETYLADETIKNNDKDAEFTVAPGGTITKVSGDLTGTTSIVTDALSNVKAPQQANTKGTYKVQIHKNGEVLVGISH